jgi:hypothetical protein
MPVTARRFTLRDTMIIVAGLAVALAWHQGFLVYHKDNFILAKNLRISRNGYYSLWLRQWAPFLVMMTITGLALRAIAPRARWDELRGQPGWVAGVVTLLSMLVAGIELLVIDTLRARGWSVYWNVGMFWSVFGARLQEAGLFVAVAWATLILIGRWRPEPEWVDRFGRVVGVLWIGYYAVQFGLGYAMIF